MRTILLIWALVVAYRRCSARKKNSDGRLQAGNHILKTSDSLKIGINIMKNIS